MVVGSPPKWEAGNASCEISSWHMTRCEERCERGEP